MATARVCPGKRGPVGIVLGVVSAKTRPSTSLGTAGTDAAECTCSCLLGMQLYLWLVSLQFWPSLSLWQLGLTDHPGAHPGFEPVGPREEFGSGSVDFDALQTRVTM
jgi:hypothetical protein